MQPYQNLNGNSGVVAYQIGHGSIDIEFRDGSVYRYAEWGAGRGALAMMQRLAQEGRGLSTFISQHVKDSYHKRLR